MIHTELVAAVIAVFITYQAAWFPEGHAPETTEQREARVALALEDIVTESEDIYISHDLHKLIGIELIDLVALSVVQAKWESGGLAYEIHSGTRVVGRPSPFGDGGRARCFFQMQKTASEVPFDKWRPFEADEWIALSGLDRQATQRCARAGVRAIAYHAWRCRRPLGSLFKNGELTTAMDRRWFAANVYRENWKPRSWGMRCRGPNGDSIDRANSFTSFRRQLVRELDAARSVVD